MYQLEGDVKVEHRAVEIAMCWTILVVKAVLRSEIRELDLKGRVVLLVWALTMRKICN